VWPVMSSITRRASAAGAALSASKEDERLQIPVGGLLAASPPGTRRCGQHADRGRASVTLVVVPEPAQPGTRRMQRWLSGWEHHVHRDLEVRSTSTFGASECSMRDSGGRLTSFRTG
jgi:hypothetical protein